MEQVLVLMATQPGGGLVKSSLEAVTAGSELASLLGGELLIGIVGGELGSAAEQIAGAGARRVLAVTGEAFEQSRYATDALAFERICREVDPAFVVAVGNARLSRVIPGVAFRVGGRVDTHVVGWERNGEDLRVTRWFYRQRMKGVLTRTARPWWILLDAGVAAPWVGSGSAVEIDTVGLQVEEGLRRTQVKEILEPPSAERTIRPDAELLFVAGAGWTKRQTDGKPHVEQAERLIRGFLDLAKASLGGSKSMVDLAGEGQKTLSFMSHLNQIGQTGATPRHPKGLATCCHGEEPHVVGWRFINERRAVNTDPNCGWAQGKADVLYVADAFEVMEKVNQLLSQG